jgi:hypothetical protein
VVERAARDRFAQAGGARPASSAAAVRTRPSKAIESVPCRSVRQTIELVASRRASVSRAGWP